MSRSLLLPAALACLALTSCASTVNLVTLDVYAGADCKLGYASNPLGVGDQCIQVRALCRCERKR